jgi:hypothetical protein
MKDGSFSIGPSVFCEVAAERMKNNRSQMEYQKGGSLVNRPIAQLLGAAFAFASPPRRVTPAR